MLTHSVVFFTVDRSSCIVSNSDIKGDCAIGQIVEVKWPETQELFDAKILYMGSSADCEKKVKLVTKDGKIAGRKFSIAPSAPKQVPDVLSRHVASPLDDDIDQPSLSDVMSAISQLSKKVDHCLQNQDELFRRFRNIENLSHSRHDKEKEIETKLESIGYDTTNACDQLRHVIKRLPQKVVQGSIEFLYASKEEVEGIRMLKPDYKKFALELETVIYRDEIEQLCLNVEKRVSTADRIDFLKTCVYHYFTVAVESRETIWRDIKQTLNAKARRMQRGRNAGTPTSRSDRNQSYSVTDLNDSLYVEELSRPSTPLGPNLNSASSHVTSTYQPLDDIYTFDG